MTSTAMSGVKEYLKPCAYKLSEPRHSMALGCVACCVVSRESLSGGVTACFLHNEPAS